MEQGYYKITNINQKINNTFRIINMNGVIKDDDTFKTIKEIYKYEESSYALQISGFFSRRWTPEFDYFMQTQVTTPYPILDLLFDTTYTPPVRLGFMIGNPTYPDDIFAEPIDKNNLCQFEYLQTSNMYTPNGVGSSEDNPFIDYILYADSTLKMNNIYFQYKKYNKRLRVESWWELDRDKIYSAHMKIYGVMFPFLIGFTYNKLVAGINASDHLGASFFKWVITDISRHRVLNLNLNDVDQTNFNSLIAGQLKRSMLFYATTKKNNTFIKNPYSMLHNSSTYHLIIFQ